MVRDMILLVHGNCIWPRTHPRCPVTHQNVSRVLEKALKIFATIVTLKVHSAMTDSWFVKASLRPHHSQMVEDCACSHKIGYVRVFYEILNLERHQNCTTGSKIIAMMLNG